MAGRPKKKIDYELVEKLAYIQCTQELECMYPIDDLKDVIESEK